MRFPPIGLVLAFVFSFFFGSLFVHSRVPIVFLSAILLLETANFDRSQSFFYLKFLTCHISINHSEFLWNHQPCLSLVSVHFFGEDCPVPQRVPLPIQPTLRRERCPLRNTPPFVLHPNPPPHCSVAHYEKGKEWGNRSEFTTEAVPLMSSRRRCEVKFGSFFLSFY